MISSRPKPKPLQPMEVFADLLVAAGLDSNDTLIQAVVMSDGTVHCTLLDPTVPQMAIGPSILIGTTTKIVTLK